MVVKLFNKSRITISQGIMFFPSRTESKPELVKTEMGPPPSPASTCSDTSSIASSASLPYSMSVFLWFCLPLSLWLSQLSV